MLNISTDILYYDEILAIRKLIELSCNLSIYKYQFSSDELLQALREINQKDSDSLVDSLKIKRILISQQITSCSICRNNPEYCTCEEDSSIQKNEYFEINIEVLFGLFLEMLKNLYDVQLKFEWKNQKKAIVSIGNDEFHYNLHFFFEKLSNDLLTSDHLQDEIIISLMPVEFTGADNPNIYEWHSIIQESNVSTFKRVIKEKYVKKKSKDRILIELGQDRDSKEIERVNDLLRKFLTKKGFTSFTIPSKYEPESIDYALPIESIKECLIYNSKKVFIFRSTIQGQIQIAYFKDGIINRDEDTFNLIIRFNNFIKERTEKLRILEGKRQNASNIEKAIQLSGPAVTTLTFVGGVLAKNPTFKAINEILVGNMFLWIFVIINILSFAFTVIFSILPNIKYGFFKWDRGLSEMIKKR